jgi:hypothetical protein
MPLFQVWDAIIDPKIAIEHGYAAKKKGDKGESSSSAATADLSSAGTGPFGISTSAASGSSPFAASVPPVEDTAPPTAADEELEGFSAPRVEAKGKDANKDGKAAKSRPKTPPPPLPTASAKSVEDPTTWSQEFDEDTEFVDAADLLDEEPTINSKGGLGGKESTV